MKNRTRIAAKVALLSCLSGIEFTMVDIKQLISCLDTSKVLFSDELKHIIGSETTRRGLLTVFELFQKPILNRRLLYVLLEGILYTLFPDKDMNKLFIKLYSKSSMEHKDSHKTR